MKHLLINFLFILFIFFIMGFDNSKTNIKYREAINELITEFYQGLENDSEFELFLGKIGELEEEIDEYNDNVDNEDSNNLLVDVEAIYSFIGEISPLGNSFLLTREQYYIAIRLLNIQPYKHPELDTGENCLRLFKLFLWDDTYQVIMIENKSDKMTDYNAIVARAIESETGYGTLSEINATVDCFSFRGLKGFFTTKDGALFCKHFSCKELEYCINKQ